MLLLWDFLPIIPISCEMLDTFTTSKILHNKTSLFCLCFKTGQGNAITCYVNKQVIK